MKHSVLLLSACLLAGATFTACETTNSGQPDRFATADANHDGNLSLDETNTYLVRPVFESRDLDHDGKVTLAETGAAGDKAAAKEFRLADANHDGAVTQQEALAYGRKSGAAAKFVKGADTDHNGAVSRTEANAYYSQREGSPR